MRTKAEPPLHSSDATDENEARASTAPHSLADTIALLEASLSRGSAIDGPAIDAVVERARARADNAVLGRALCLAGRAHILSSRYERSLESAAGALQAFGALEAPDAARHAGYTAETLRAAGTAYVALGRLTEGLAKLEEAVRIAQAGVDAQCSDQPNPTVVCAVSALIRSLISLGLALFAVRETDTAIDVYYRALALAATRPEVYEYFLDDILVTHWNLADALHERIERRRAAGDAMSVQRDIRAARAVLEAQAPRMEPGARSAGTSLNAFVRLGYFAAYGRHLLITDKPLEAQAMYERLLAENERERFLYDWVGAQAHLGLMQAALALGSAHAALRHSRRALAGLDRHDDANARAAVLLGRARALRKIGRYRAAYATLERHQALRSRLEAAAAQNYAQHMTARLGVEHARADSEAHRQIAAMLETLAKIGQEITANLDTDVVFGMLHRHVGALLCAATFTVWLIDTNADCLTLRFGIEDERPFQARDIPLDDPYSLAARAVRERHETVADTTTPPSGLRRLANGTAPMQSALFAPLIVAERVLGVISIQSHSTDAYGESDRLIFRTLSSYGAIALDNAAAYRKLAQTVDALQVAQAELGVRTAEYERLSMTDPLTEVANRRRLNERAAVEIAALVRKDGELAVVMFDIDHFKRVNDNYGHAAGDSVLQTVARIAKSWLRPADLLARIGGEEFALLLPGAGLREALSIAERIRRSIEQTPIDAGSASVRITSSFGAATFAGSADTLDGVLRRADRALYAAKNAGRNRVHSAGG